MGSFRKRLHDSLTFRVLPYVGAFLFRVFALTIRFEEKGSETMAAFERDRRPYIAAFWHGHILMMLASPYRMRSKAMISSHRDGELISKMAAHFGVGSIRGSTTRGGIQALKGAIRAVHQGFKVVVTPDGPRGPRYIVQPGVIELARVTGVPIIPIVFSCTRKKIFSSWDRFILPYPFTRGVFFYGEPFYVERQMGKEALEIKRKELEKRMQRMMEQVERYCETGIWR